MRKSIAKKNLIIHEFNLEEISEETFREMKKAFAKLGKHLGDVDVELCGEEVSDTAHLYLADKKLTKKQIRECFIRECFDW